MTFVQLLFHVANFVLPVLALATLMPLAGRLVMGTSSVPAARRMRYHAMVGGTGLMGGLLVQGQDGLMVTYMLMVLLAATLEWALQRRRRG